MYNNTHIIYLQVPSVKDATHVSKIKKRDAEEEPEKPDELLSKLTLGEYW